VHQGTHAPSLGQTQQDGAADASAHVHPLLGRRIISPVTDVVQFSARVSSASSPYLRDHRVYGAVLLPATAFLDMALAAGEALGLRQCVLEQVVISKPFQVPDDERALLHLAVRVPPAPAPATVQIFSRQVESAAIGTTSSAAPVWVLHAQATLGAAGGAPSGPEVPTLSEARAACTTEIASRDFYRSLSDRGFAYGPAFQGMVQAWIGPGVAVAHVVLPDAGHAAGSGYVIHPAMLDACCQVLATLAPAPSAGHAELFVPVGLDALSRSGDIGTDVWTVVAVRPGTHASHGVLVADVHLFDAAGACLARVAGLRFARVTREALLGTAPPPVHATASAFIPPLRRTLQSTAGDARSAILRAFIIERIATIIGRANDQIDATKPLNAMGFDSLMAGELSLDIEDALGLVIPMERFRDVPTIDRIIALLLDHLATEQHPHDDAPGTVDAMSDEEVERQLRARLERPGA
jgi:acyl transferase domain-containing protein